MKDARLKKLVVLGVVTLAFAGLATSAVIWRARQSQTQMAPAPFLPGFSAQVKNAQRIHISSKAASFDVAYSEGAGWTLPAKGNYPADFEQVRHLLIGLAALETIAPKTARADWLPFIGLDDPGSGTHVVVSDAHGVALADVITGKAMGDGAIFVRRGGETQSWLARAPYAPEPQLGPWLMQGVYSINAARLMNVTTPAVTVQREHTSDQNYVMASVPAGKFNPTAVNGLAAAILDFAIADVRPVADMDFTGARQVTARTFDGVILTMALVQKPDGVWAKISASAVPGAVTAFRQEAEGIAARAAPWAYKLGPEQARALMAGREDFLAPAGVQ